MATRAPAPAPAAADQPTAGEAAVVSAANAVGTASTEGAGDAQGTGSGGTGLADADRAELEALRAEKAARAAAGQGAADEKEAEAARKAQAVADEITAGLPQTKVYPDGSERRGCPPWPEMSPLQEEQAMKRKQAEDMGEGTKIPAGDNPFGL